MYQVSSWGNRITEVLVVRETEHCYFLPGSGKEKETRRMKDASYEQIFPTWDAAWLSLVSKAVGNILYDMQRLQEHRKEMEEVMLMRDNDPTIKELVAMKVKKGEPESVELKKVRAAIDAIGKFEKLVEDEEEKYKRAIDKHVRNVTALKNFVLAYCKKHKVTSLQGDVFEAEAKTKFSTDVDPQKVYELAKKRKEEEVFWTCVKLLITDSKKFLGEPLLKKAGMKETATPYNSIKVKPIGKGTQEDEE